MKLISFSFQAATLGLWILSLGGYLGDRYWLLDLMAHFKLQYLWLGMIPLIFFSLRRQPRWAIASLLCVALNLAVILPWYLPASAVAATPPRSLRLVTLNVNVQNRNYPPALAFLQAEKADLIMVTEVNQAWLQALQPLTAELPYVLTSPTANAFGSVLYSRFPLEAITLPDSAQPQFAPGSRIVATVQVKATRLQVAALHPPPPIRQPLAIARDRELATVANYLQSLKNSKDLPVIALGDFNITLWSPIYQRFEHKTGLRNTRQGFGVLPSWNIRLPFLRLPIDHCLVSSAIVVQQTKVGPNVGSDHLPLIADLSY